MTKLIDEAIAVLEQLPRERQEVVVRAILTYASGDERDE